MMGLLRDLSIKDVCHHLDIVLQPDDGYHLLRKEMTDIASEAGVLPTRISFVAALNTLVSQVRVSGKGATGNIPNHLKGMRENIKVFILPEKRKHRRYDRSVLYVPPKSPFSFKLREA